MVGAKQKKYLNFSLDRHGILAGPGSEDVLAAISSFVMEILLSAGRGLPQE
jgi:hypothetical protein